MNELTIWDYCVGVLIILGLVGVSLFGWYMTASGAGLWLKSVDLEGKSDPKAKELEEVKKRNRFGV